MPEHFEDEWLTIAEVAELTRLSHSTIKRQINLRTFPSYNIVGRVRVRKADVEAWLASCRN